MVSSIIMALEIWNLVAEDGQHNVISFLELSEIYVTQDIFVIGTEPPGSVQHHQLSKGKDAIPCL